MKRSLIIGLIGLPALIVVIGLSGLFWLRTSLPELSGSEQLTGINSPVSITRDGDGVPHILAESDEDAYFALGYVHAQDRFWQMETMRRFGGGRLSEIMGDATLGADRWMRTLGLYRLAELQAQSLDEPVRRALAAYARGVNGWLKNRSGLPSPEFAGFYFTPEPWQIADSLVWGKIMATRLAGNFRTEVLRALIARKIAPERVGELWPAYPANAPFTITGLSPEMNDRLFAGLSVLPPWPNGQPTGASNIWALGPDKTETGGAILANDPHLGFSAPIMWYLARIETPDLQIMGATVPGVPFHILGVNNDIAWGITSTQADSEDLFVEKLVAGNSSRYLISEGDAEFEVREEIIKVKGQPDQVLNVRSSYHGPVLSDVRGDIGSLGDDNHVVALSATYLENEDLTSSAFFHLNRAKNWRAFQDAVRLIQGPVLNFAYADSSGNIGFRTAGKVPVRGAGSGVVPSPGWLGETDWMSFIPFDEMPSEFNPPAAMIINANNRVVGEDYPYFISHDWAARYRADRIEQQLGTTEKVAFKQVQSLQNDAVSLMAKDILPKLLAMATAERDADKAALSLLQKWDGTMARKRPEPLIFSTWLLELNKLVYSDELENLTPAYLKLRPRFIKSVLTRRPLWCDDIKTPKPENCTELVNHSFRRTIDRLSEQHGANLEKWAWGKTHRATFTHQVLTRVPLLNHLADISIPTDGGNYTVNRGATRPNNERSPFAHIHGPGYRAIYDLNDIANSRFMIATGQSGNFLSEHYADLVSRWRDGGYLTFMSEAQDNNTRNVKKLTLLPKKAPSREKRP